MNTLIRSTIAVAALVGARAAHASCFITGLHPDEAMLPTMDVGQEFSFVATDDCVELRFYVRGTRLTKIPKSGPDGKSKENTYKVVLTEREWNMVAGDKVDLTWSIIGTSSAGETTRVTQTNDIDHDVHFELGASEADAKLSGDATSDQAGASVSSAGDVNGDGNDDVLIGAPGKWGARGTAYVVTGPVSGDIDLSVASFLGEGAEDAAATSVSFVDDLNDDGYDELLIGAPGNDDETGAAYLLYGPVTGRPTPGGADVKLVGEGPRDRAGFSVSGTGDVDGDGLGDLLVGSFWQSDQPRAGAAYLVLGETVTGSTFELAEADAKLFGPTQDDPGLGVNVARAGTWTATAPTIWRSAWTGTMSSAWRVPRSPSRTPIPWSPWRWTTCPSLGIVRFDPESLADAASALSGAGDVDNDGCDDLLIGASDNLTGTMKAGAAYLILGPLGGTESEDIELAEAQAKFVGEDPATGPAGGSRAPGTSTATTTTTS